MFNETKGSINGKRNRRLFAWFRKRKKIKEEEFIEDKKKQEIENDKKSKIVCEKIIDNQVINKNNLINDKAVKNTYVEPIVIPTIENLQSDEKQETVLVENEKKFLNIETNSKKDIDDKNKNTDIPIKLDTKDVSSKEKENTTNYFDDEISQAHKEDKKLKPNYNNEKLASKNTSTSTQVELLEAVTHEINNILDDKQYELKKIAFEFEVLTDKANDAVYSAEVEDIQKEIEVLLEKLRKIYRELELLTNSSTFQNVHQIDDPYLTDIIDEYINSQMENRNITKQVDKIETNKEYKSIVSKIVEIDKEKDKLEEKLIEKMKYYQIRDDEFERWKDSYMNVDMVTSYLNNMVNDSKKMLDNIEEKVRKNVTVTEVVETKIKNSLTLMGKALLFMSLLSNKPTKNNPAFNAVTTFTAINLVHDVLKPKKIITKRYETDLVDYSEMINNTIGNVSKVNRLIDSNIFDISALKQDFQRNFSEFQNDIPEYKELITRLDDIEKEMIKQKKEILKTTYSLDEQYNKNKEKVKKYRDLNCI